MKEEKDDLDKMVDDLRERGRELEAGVGKSPMTSEWLLLETMLPSLVDPVIIYAALSSL